MNQYMNAYAAERMLSLATDADFRDVPLEYALKAYEGELNDQHLIDTVLIPSFAKLCDMMESQLAALAEADALALLSKVNDLTKHGYRDDDGFTDKYAGTGFGILVELRFRVKELSGIGIDVDELRSGFLTYDNSVTSQDDEDGEGNVIWYDLPSPRDTLKLVEDHSVWTKIRKEMVTSSFYEQVLNYGEHFSGIIYSSNYVEDKPVNLTNSTMYTWQEFYEAERELGHHVPRFDTVWFAFMDILDWFIKTVNEAFAEKIVIDSSHE